MKKILFASIALLLVGCSQQTQAETTPTTIETTTVIETTVEESTTEAETSIASMGKYGEYGKEMYDILVADWLEWLYADEGELRLNATVMLGSISEENYEAIIEEILAMDRGTNPHASTQAEATAVQPTQSESKPAQSTNQSQPTQPTQSTNQSQQPAPTQPAPTQPAPEQQLAPGALSIEEIERRKAEAGLDGDIDVEIVDEIHGDANAGQGYDWN